MSPRFQPIADAPPVPLNVGTNWPMTEAEIHDRAPELAALLAPLIPAGEVVELRALHVPRGNWSPTVSGYYDDPLKFAADALRLSNAGGPGAYFTLNVVNPALLHRRGNKVKDIRKDEPTTKDEDIVRRRWLFLDFDAGQPAGISATDGEKAKAWALLVMVWEDMRARGWPEPLVADSGNGFCALYRIDQPADDGGLVERCLKALAARYDTKGPHLDTAVHNPARIIRVPGTANRKGDDAADRPHRTGGIIHIPDVVEVVPTSLLEDLAAEAPTSAKGGPKTAPSGNPADNPLDDFSTRAPWEETGLFRDGWQIRVDFGGGKMHLTRPDKATGEGLSATVGFAHPDKDGNPTFWAFTSNSTFTPLKAYTKTQVFARLNGFGDAKAGAVDWGAVAKALRTMGYGKQEPTVTFGGEARPGAGNRASDHAGSQSASRANGKQGATGANSRTGATAKPILVRLSDVTAEAIRWTWDKRFPCGRLSLICGHPGASKSVFAMMMAAITSRGGRWPDHARAPMGDVLLLSSEDGIGDTVRPRLDVAGADCSRIQALTGYCITNEDGEKEVALTMGNVDIIHDALAQMNSPKLVVVDPVGSYLGGGVDAHRDNEVRAVLAPMAALAEKFDVAIMLVAHTTKAKPTRADDGILGSRAFSGIVRCTHHIGVDPDNPGNPLAVPPIPPRVFFLPGKNNIGPRMSGLAYRVVSAPHPVGSQPLLEFESEPVEVGADEAFGGGGGGGGGASEKKPGPEPVKRDAAATWLVSILRHGPQPKAVIDEEAKAAGFAPKTVRNAREYLGVESYKSGLTGCYFWRLPDGFDLSEYPAEQGAGCPGPEAEVALVHGNQGNLGENKGETPENPRGCPSSGVLGQPLVANEGNLPPRPGPAWQAELLALLTEFGAERRSTSEIGALLNDRLQGPAPDEKTLRKFLTQKFNAGEVERRGQSLTTHTWRIAQAAPTTPDRATSMAWLKSRLAAGPCAQATLLAEAEAAGLSIVVAALALRVDVYDADGVLTCRLPDASFDIGRVLPD